MIKNYEARIDELQKQVEEQSMTMSMYSSITPEDLNNDGDDIFGKLFFYFYHFITTKIII